MGYNCRKSIQPNLRERSFYKYMNAKTSRPELTNKRDDILAAVTAVFKRYGFHGASMRDICAAADMSPGALYRYFPSKEEMIEAVIGQHHERWAAVFREAVQAGGFFDALDYLTASILEQEEVDNLPLWMEIAAEASRNDRVAGAQRAHYEAMTTAMTELAAQAVTNGELSTGTNPRDVAAVVIAAFDGLKLRRGGDTDFDFRRTLRCSLLLLGQALGGRATNTRVRRTPPE